MPEVSPRRRIEATAFSRRLQFCSTQFPFFNSFLGFLSFLHILELLYKLLECFSLFLKFQNQTTIERVRTRVRLDTHKNLSKFTSVYLRSILWIRIKLLYNKGACISTRSISHRRVKFHEVPFLCVSERLTIR